MYHLLDKDQVELDGFNAFGPGDVSEAGAAAEAGDGEDKDVSRVDSVSPAAAREQLEAGAARAAPSVAAAAAAAVESKAKEARGSKRGAGDGAAASKKGKVAASTTGTQRGKAGPAAQGMDREEMRRLGLYAAFLLPLADSLCPNGKRNNVSVRFANIGIQSSSKFVAKIGVYCYWGMPRVLGISREDGGRLDVLFFRLDTIGRWANLFHRQIFPILACR